MKTQTKYTIRNASSGAISNPLIAEKIQLYIDDAAKSHNIQLTYHGDTCSIVSGRDVLADIRAVQTPVFEPEKLNTKNIYQDHKEIQK